MSTNFSCKTLAVDSRSYPRTRSETLLHHSESINPKWKVFFRTKMLVFVFMSLHINSKMLLQMISQNGISFWHQTHDTQQFFDSFHVSAIIVILQFDVGVFGSRYPVIHTPYVNDPRNAVYTFHILVQFYFWIQLSMDLRIELENINAYVTGILHRIHNELHTYGDIDSRKIIEHSALCILYNRMHNNIDMNLKRVIANMLQYHNCLKLNEVSENKFNRKKKIEHIPLV